MALLARDNPMTLVLGPILWGLHFTVVYVFNAIACEKALTGLTVVGLPLVPAGIAAATLLILLLLGGLALLAWRRYWPVRDARPLVHERDVERARPARQRFMALTALLLVMLSAIATVMVGLPALWMPACS